MSKMEWICLGALTRGLKREGYAEYLLRQEFPALSKVEISELRTLEIRRIG